MAIQQKAALTEPDALEVAAVIDRVNAEEAHNFLMRFSEEKEFHLMRLGDVWVAMATTEAGRFQSRNMPTMVEALRSLSAIIK